jgi:site-specific DNA-methyltransferase (adenine-specific)
MDCLGSLAFGHVCLTDWLDGLRSLPGYCLDLLATDPPYGSTRNAWDKPVEWARFFPEAWRILRPPAPIVALVDFETALRMRAADAIGSFRYEIVCPHNLPTGHLNAARRPMVAHLFLLVFCREEPPWNPQMTMGPPTHRRRVKALAAGSTYGAHARTWIDYGGRKWPTSVLPFDGVPHGKREHASEKPVPLAEWILRTFTEEGATVLDPFAGSGWVACAAIRAGRRSLGFDADQSSVDLAERRIAAEHERRGDVLPSDALKGQQVGLLRGGKR